MRPEGPRSLGDLLLAGDLGRLRAEAERRRTLTREIRNLLPRTVARHVVGAHRDAQGRLVIAADSAAWAARLRFVADDAGLGQVIVRVAPRGETAGDPPPSGDGQPV